MNQIIKLYLLYFKLLKVLENITLHFEKVSTNVRILYFSIPFFYYPFLIIPLGINSSTGEKHEKSSRFMDDNHKL